MATEMVVVRQIQNFIPVTAMRQSGSIGSEESRELDRMNGTTRPCFG